MEFQRGQQLADALDLSSRLAQREAASDKKESQLFNALCDQNRPKTGEEEKEKDREDDWRQFLRRDVPLTDPYFPRGAQSSSLSQSSSNYWSKWSTRTSTSGCASLTSSDIPISDIPELAWDASSFSESYDYSDSFLGSLDCNSITTHYDFLDTHSEHDFVSHKQNQKPKAPCLSSMDAYSDIIPRSSRNSLPGSCGGFPTPRVIHTRTRCRTLHAPVHTDRLPYIQPIQQSQPQVIPEYTQGNNSKSERVMSWRNWSDGERKNYIEQLVQRLSISDQWEVIRIIDPETDIQSLASSGANQVLIPVHSIDQNKFDKVQQYVAQITCSPTSRRNEGSTQVQTIPTHLSATKISPSNSQPYQLRRSNSDPNLADATQNAANRQKERETKLRQRRIFRWLNSQKSQTTRRKRQLQRERQSGLFLRQEVIEVQNDETIDEQNEEIDVC